MQVEPAACGSISYNSGAHNAKVQPHPRQDIRNACTAHQLLHTLNTGAALAGISVACTQLTCKLTRS